MIVRVCFFARTRDLAGTGVAEFEIAEGSTVGALRGCLAERYPALVGILQRCALAVNNEFAEEVQVLSDHAEVALLPPVSGGGLSGREP